MTGRPAPFLGILMLDTTFDRFPGDVGNPETWSFPVRFRTVVGASADRITGAADETFLAPFVAAARELVAEGAIGISTSCGFLSVYQRQLAKALPVPVLTSSLLLLPLIESTLPSGKRVGIITFSDERLRTEHLAAADIRPDAAVQGLPSGGCFHRSFLDGERTGDTYAAREREALWAADALAARHPDLGAILLECTNLAPHARAIERRLRLPVHDITTALNWLWAGLRPTGFARRHAAHEAQGTPS